MSLFSWFKKPAPQASPPQQPMRCGTPYIQSGGILLAHTGNVVTIIQNTPPKAKQPDQP